MGADIDLIFFFKDISDTRHQIFELLDRHLNRFCNIWINFTNASSIIKSCLNEWIKGFFADIYTSLSSWNTLSTGQWLTNCLTMIFRITHSSSHFKADGSCSPSNRQSQWVMLKGFSLNVAQIKNARVYMNLITVFSHKVPRCILNMCEGILRALSDCFC